MARPVLYSFRRCPYAIRARLAVAVSGVEVEVREVLLRDKAPAFLKVSPSATVPCLKVGDVVLDESLDIMVWALGQSDPDKWLDVPGDAYELIAQADGPFKHALDRTKYETRYPDCDPEEQRALGMKFLAVLEFKLQGGRWLFGDTATLPDMAILPFVRQFAFIDKARFDLEAGEHTRRWLDGFLSSDLFQSVMPKLAVWQDGDSAPVLSGTIQKPRAAGRASPAH